MEKEAACWAGLSLKSLSDGALGGEIGLKIMSWPGIIRNLNPLSAADHRPRRDRLPEAAALKAGLLRPGETPRAWLVILRVIFWGLRPAVHIGLRNLGKDEDETRNCASNLSSSKRGPPPPLVFYL